MKIVLTQPMYFPWIGLFEQVKLADLLIYYDDVQFSKGSFTNRVQLKNNSRNGIKWMTLPLNKFKLGSKIDSIGVNHQANWRTEHLKLYEMCYKDAPFYLDGLAILEKLTKIDSNNLAEITISSMQLVLNYFGMPHKTILKSSDLGIYGSNNNRVLEIVSHFNCSTYITGHGAKNYLNHELFEKNGIKVEYINYNKNIYSQQFDGFNPYVSVLDLIANTGKEGIAYMNSQTIYWKNYV